MFPPILTVLNRDSNSGGLFAVTGAFGGAELIRLCRVYTGVVEPGPYTSCGAPPPLPPTGPIEVSHSNSKKPHEGDTR